MKLFTRSDVERAARLAALAVVNERFASGTEGVEYAVSIAMDTVTEETPPYYDEETVKKMLLYTSGTDREPSELLEEALHYVRR